MPKKVDPLAAWRKHVAAHQKKNPTLSLKAALQEAKLTYNLTKDDKPKSETKEKPKPKRKPKAKVLPEC